MPFDAIIVLFILEIVFEHGCLMVAACVIYSIEFFNVINWVNSIEWQVIFIARSFFLSLDNEVKARGA